MTRFVSRYPLVSIPSHAAIILTSAVLCAGTWLTLPTSAQTVPSVPDPIPAGQILLPNQVRDRLLTFVARDLNVPQSTLQITEVTPMVWPDGCLGVPSPAELCVAALTPGWQVELFDGEVYRVYRADEPAQQIRAEPPLPADVEELPRLTASRVLDDIVQTYGLSLEELDIVAARPRTWDGCLGLAGPAEACPQIALMGWQVIVAAPDHVWIYHTNHDGTLLQLNEAASQLGNAAGVPAFITAETCVATAAEPLITVTTSGGIAGRTDRQTLYSDGTLLQSTAGTATQIGQLSEADLAAFIDQIYSLRLDHLVGLRYPPLPHTADSFQIVVKLGSYEAIQYDELALASGPDVLQQFHALWQTLPVATLPCPSSHQ